MANTCRLSKADGGYRCPLGQWFYVYICPEAEQKAMVQGKMAVYVTLRRVHVQLSWPALALVPGTVFDQKCVLVPLVSRFVSTFSLRIC